MNVTMKIIIFLIVLKLWMQDIFCNESILSKFHQNVYKMKDHRADLVSYNEKYFNVLQMRTYKYNRTTAAVNFTSNMKVTMKDKIEVLIQVHKFLSNEYRHFPVRFQVNLKKAFDANAVGIKAVRNCGNVTNFYFEKDITYYVCNFVVDETQFPPLIPTGRYRADVHVLYLNDEIALINGYVEIYTPIAYPKK